MKIKILKECTNVGGMGRALKPGEVLEVSDAEGTELLRAGIATGARLEEAPINETPTDVVEVEQEDD